MNSAWFKKIGRFMVRDMHLGDALQEVVSLVVEFMECDSCLLYLLKDQDLVLCASNNPQPNTIGRLQLKLGEGLTGWVARERRRLLSVSREAYIDPRFKVFAALPGGHLRSVSVGARAGAQPRHRCD